VNPPSCQKEQAVLQRSCFCLLDCAKSCAAEWSSLAGSARQTVKNVDVQFTSNWSVAIARRLVNFFLAAITNFYRHRGIRNLWQQRGLGRSSSSRHDINGPCVIGETDRRNRKHCLWNSGVFWSRSEDGSNDPGPAIDETPSARSLFRERRVLGNSAANRKPQQPRHKISQIHIGQFAINAFRDRIQVAD
jgi:hypothetical protein